MESTTHLSLRRSEYDVYSQCKLEHELGALRPGECVIDFRDVVYLDSTALGVLIRRLKQLREIQAETSFTLANVRPQVAFVFRTTSLDGVFEIQEAGAA